MGSQSLLAPASQLSFMMKVALYFVAVVAVCNAESWLAGPYTLVKRAAEPQRSPSTRFFTGNRPLDAGIAGAAAGVATQYFANQIFNPCTRGATGTTTGGPTTGSLVARLFKTVSWALPLVLLERLWSTMLKEILVGDK